MKKILLTLWIGSLIPGVAFAEGSLIGNIVNRVFSGTAVEQVAAPADGSHLSGQITNMASPMPVQNQPYSQAYQQNYAPQMAAPNYAQQQKMNEDLVRCVYIGATVGENTKFAEESVVAQDNARRAGKLLAGLNCNQILAPYSNVIKQADQALNACSENDEYCGTINEPQASNGGIHK